MNAILKFSFYILICVLDTIIWLILNSLDGQKIINILKKRPWLKLSLRKNSVFKKKYSTLINRLIILRCKRKPILSSCLSRSSTARVLLDFLKIQNDLYLGMNKDEKGNKIPHAWIKQEKSNIYITPGLNKKNLGVKLIKL